jgi:hypothetical protein
MPKVPQQQKRTIKKPSLLRSNNLVYVITVGDDNYEIDSDDVLQTGFRRPELVELDNDDDELSDYVKFRLFLARQLALMKFEYINNISPRDGIVKDGT